MAKSKFAGFARFGGIGDDLMAATVARPLKNLGYHVEVLTREPAGVVFENNPFIDKITYKGEKDIPGDPAQWQMWFEQRRKEYTGGKFQNLSHSCEMHTSWFTGTTRFWWPDSYRRKVSNYNYQEACCDILEVPYEFGPLFFPTRAEKKKAQATRDKVAAGAVASGIPRAAIVVGWVLSGSRVDKIYPHAPLAIARIIKELGCPVVMLGASPREFDMAKVVMEVVKTHNSSLDNLHLALNPVARENVITNKPGERVTIVEEKPLWPIRRILTQAQFCDLVITPDTGPAWAVAHEPMPKIVTLSHASPENVTKHWVNTVTLHADQKAVPCWPCHRLHDDLSTCKPNAQANAAACMDDINVELLLEVTARLLSSTDSAKP